MHKPGPSTTSDPQWVATQPATSKIKTPKMTHEIIHAMKMTLLLQYSASILLQQNTKEVQ